MKIHYESIGRGASLLLNLPPDRRGRIHENDIASLKEFRRILDETFAVNFAEGATLTASNVRGGAARFGAANVLDGKRDTYWSTDDGMKAPELVVGLRKEATFNVVDIREFLPLGQRVDTWALDKWAEGKWVEFAKGEAIGNRRLWRGEYQTTARVRLRLTGPVCPAIGEFGLYAEPVRLGAPTIRRDREGRVTLAASMPGPTLRYTLDGSEPDGSSPLYAGPVDFLAGGTVRARAFVGERSGPTATAVYGLAKKGWSVASVSVESPGGGEAARAIDHARSGKGPYLIEYKTFRMTGHSVVSPRRHGEWQPRRARPSPTATPR